MFYWPGLVNISLWLFMQRTHKNKWKKSHRGKFGAAVDSILTWGRSATNQANNSVDCFYSIIFGATKFLFHYISMKGNPANVQDTQFMYMNVAEWKTTQKPTKAAKPINTLGKCLRKTISAVDHGPFNECRLCFVYAGCPNSRLFLIDYFNTSILHRVVYVVILNIEMLLWRDLCNQPGDIQNRSDANRNVCLWWRATGRVRCKHRDRGKRTRPVWDPWLWKPVLQGLLSILTDC